MSSLSKTYLIFILAVLGTGCSSNPPSATVSEAVIQSVVPDPQATSPWRLDNAWQGGGLGGSVLRSASIEHVIRQADNRLPASISASSSGLDLTSHPRVTPTAKPPSYSNRGNDETVERAWRKYCHHQLDMTAEDYAVMRRSSVPRTVLHHGCHPQSLLK
ncbi:MAG: hypothetical protein CTY16_01365 [Methylobacter sp.]|nr:MAG: hypothetical protein CTY16_01365 [Methylobacter sp.]